MTLFLDIMVICFVVPPVIAFLLFSDDDTPHHNRRKRTNDTTQYTRRKEHSVEYYTPPVFEAKYCSHDNKKRYINNITDKFQNKFGNLTKFSNTYSA